jgi:hypothetical protein
LESPLGQRCGHSVIAIFQSKPQKKEHKGPSGLAKLSYYGVFQEKEMLKMSYEKSIELL